MRVRKVTQESYAKYYGEDHDEYSFDCPGGCGEHRVTVKWGSKANRTTPQWGFNGDVNFPTFTPSLLVRWEYNEEEHGIAHKHVCHSFITNGRIQFLGDSTHKLSGQTVDLAEIAQ